MRNTELDTRRRKTYSVYNSVNTRHSESQSLEALALPEKSVSMAADVEIADANLKVAVLTGGGE